MRRATPAVDIQTASTTANELRDLTLCDGDTDFFGYNIDEDPQTEGLLVVDLQIHPEDVGAGTVNVTVRTPAGFQARQEVATNVDENGAPTGRVYIDDVVVPTVESGSYTVEVSGEGLTSQGLRYNLTVDLVEAGILTACQAPQTLLEGMAVAGNFAQAPTQALTSSCFDGAGGAGEFVYQFELIEESYVTVESSGSADVALSIRQTCTSEASEYPGACSATPRRQHPRARRAAP